MLENSLRCSCVSDILLQPGAKKMLLFPTTVHASLREGGWRKITWCGRYVENFPGVGTRGAEPFPC